MTKQKQELGDCYEANALWIINIRMTNNDRKYLRDIKLCHGKVIGAKDSAVAGRKFGHCWIEIGEDVLIDNSNGKQIVGRISEIEKRIVKGTVKKYTINQALINMNKTQHYGYWTDEEDGGLYERK